MIYGIMNIQHDMNVYIGNLTILFIVLIINGIHCGNAHLSTMKGDKKETKGD